MSENTGIKVPRNLSKKTDFHGIWNKDFYHEGHEGTEGEKLQVLHALHGGFLFFVVPVGHGCYPEVFPCIIPVPTRLHGNV